MLGPGAGPGGMLRVSHFWPLSLQLWGQYQLFAVIAHVGLADFGHYCAYVRNAADGEWFCFNDSSVCWVRSLPRAPGVSGLSGSLRPGLTGPQGPSPHRSWPPGGACCARSPPGLQRRPGPPRSVPGRLVPSAWCPAVSRETSGEQAELERRRNSGLGVSKVRWRGAGPE